MVVEGTDQARVELVAALRRLRMTGAEIAEVLGMLLSTVSGLLARIGLGRLSRLEPLEPPNRYERARPGELVHIDVKKLGRIRGVGHRFSGRASQPLNRRASLDLGPGGWEFVHVCVDDATRTLVPTPRSASSFVHDLTVARERWDDFKARMDAERWRPPRAAGHDAP